MTKRFQANETASMIARIAIVYSEAHRGSGRVFKSLADFDAWCRDTLLVEAGRNGDAAYGVPGADGPSAYVKTWLELVWLDGERFEFRIDLNYATLARAAAIGCGIVESELASRVDMSRTKFAGTPLAYAPELIELVDARIGVLAAT
jgi:hypothetical protein